MKSPESYKTRDVYLGLPEAEAFSEGSAGCAVCGKSCERTYCSIDCYRVVQRSGSVEDRFWSKVNKTDGCWLWTASRSGGRGQQKYGQFTYLVDGKQRHVGAHVYSYELHHGPVPDGLEVMHSCHTKLCVRPDHLEAGTHSQNVKDSAIFGHYHVPRPRRQKITDEQVEQAIGMVRSGMTQVAVAKYFGVTKVTISRIMNGSLRQYRRPTAVPREGVA